MEKDKANNEGYYYRVDTEEVAKFRKWQKKIRELWKKKKEKKDD